MHTNVHQRCVKCKDFIGLTVSLRGARLFARHSQSCGSAMPWYDTHSNVSISPTSPSAPHLIGGTGGLGGKIRPPASGSSNHPSGSSLPKHLAGSRFPSVRHPMTPPICTSRISSLHLRTQKSSKRTGNPAFSSWHILRSTNLKPSSDDSMRIACCARNTRANIGCFFRISFHSIAAFFLSAFFIFSILLLFTLIYVRRTP